MDLFDEPRFFSWPSPQFDFPTSLVRMNCAMLYMRQHLRSIITELKVRTIKVFGKQGYSRVFNFGHESYSLCGMGGDRDLASLIASTNHNLNTKSNHRETIDTLGN